MIEKTHGGGRLSRRLRRISASRSARGDRRLIALWRSAVVALAVFTVAALWQRSGDVAGHVVLVSAALATVIAACATRHLEADVAAFCQAQRVLEADPSGRPCPALDNAVLDTSCLYEIRRRPASGVTWVSLAKTPVPHS